MKANAITVQTQVHLPLLRVWDFFTQPEHIRRWNAAHHSWYCPRASLDLTEGGAFNYRMEARDGSEGFDLEGQFTLVKPPTRLEYSLADGRVVTVAFEAVQGATQVTQQFEPEPDNDFEVQQAGWQAILDHFRQHAEARVQENTLQFEVYIAARPDQVCRLMLANDTYRQWTKPFCETSDYSGSWEQGATIRFTGTDAEGQTGGMVSTVREMLPGQTVVIEHLGIIRRGEELLVGPEVDAWAGAFEVYQFEPEGAGTKLRISLESHSNYQTFFKETWPKALELLKKICT